MRCLLLARGHSTTEFQCPLSGVKRTSRGRTPMSAFDPKRTFCPGICCRAKRDHQYISKQPIDHFFRQCALKDVFRVLRPPDETPLANGHFDARRYSFHNCDCYLLRLTWCGGAMSQCRAPKQLVR